MILVFKKTRQNENYAKESSSACKACGDEINLVNSHTSFDRKINRCGGSSKQLHDIIKQQLILKCTKAEHSNIFLHSKINNNKLKRKARDKNNNYDASNDNDYKF